MQPICLYSTKPKWGLAITPSVILLLISSITLSSSEIKPSQGQTPMGAQVPALTWVVFNFLFTDSISRTWVPAVPEERATRELCSGIESWQSKQHKTERHWILALETFFPQEATLIHAMDGSPIPWHLQSLIATWTGRRQHWCYVVPNCAAVLQAYGKPPAQICPTRSQPVFLQSVNPLNVMFLPFKSSLNGKRTLIKTPSSSFAAAKQLALKSDNSPSRSSTLPYSWARTEQKLSGRTTRLFLFTTQGTNKSNKEKNMCTFLLQRQRDQPKCMS